jgi:hypothetical protein
MYQQSNNTLDKIFSYSFPSNHLLNVQLMNEINNGGKYSPDKVSHFCFVGLIPGVTTNENSASRTYDFKNGITIKFSLQEISGLSFVLNMCAIGNTSAVLPYSKFAKSTSNKSVTIFEVPIDPNKKYDSRKIILKFDIVNSNSKYAITLTPDQAFSISKVLEKIFEKGISLEMERQLLAPRETKHSTVSNDEPSFSMTIPQNITQPISNNNSSQQVANLFSSF